MDTPTWILFASTVLPLVCTPGPDLLFVAAQALTGARRGGVRANVGVISGYSAHALLGAFGMAAIVAASPTLFEALRWTGIVYLVFLAVQMFRSAMRPGTKAEKPVGQQASLFKGFLTSFLNPKGLLVYELVGAAIATMGRTNDRVRRIGEGIAGGMLAFTAVRMSNR